MTKTGRQIIDVIGCKQEMLDQKTPSRNQQLTWLIAAVELLLLVEIERQAVVDNVAIDDDFCDDIRKSALEQWKINLKR
jgi:hypothetical protein